MIDFTDIPHTSIRGAIAAHYALDDKGIVLTPGPYEGQPYYNIFFAQCCSENAIETSGLWEEEIVAFNLGDVNMVTIDRTGNFPVVTFFKKDAVE